jgi:hypothetical protein
MSTSVPDRGVAQPLELPVHPYLSRLIGKTAELGVRLDRSEVDVWLYHPALRVISICEQDLLE